MILSQLKQGAKTYLVCAVVFIVLLSGCSTTTDPALRDCSLNPERYGFWTDREGFYALWDGFQETPEVYCLKLRR